MATPYLTKVQVKYLTLIAGKLLSIALEKQREAFAVARQWFEAQGGHLLNASRETKLDVLERVNFDELF